MIEPMLTVNILLVTEHWPPEKWNVLPPAVAVPWADPQNVRTVPPATVCVPGVHEAVPRSAEAPTVNDMASTATDAIGRSERRRNEATMEATLYPLHPEIAGIVHIAQSVSPRRKNAASREGVTFTRSERVVIPMFGSRSFWETLDRARPSPLAGGLCGREFTTTNRGDGGSEFTREGSLNAGRRGQLALSPLPQGPVLVRSVTRERKLQARGGADVFRRVTLSAC